MTDEQKACVRDIEQQYKQYMTINRLNCRKRVAEGNGETVYQQATGPAAPSPRRRSMRGTAASEPRTDGSKSLTESRTAGQRGSLALLLLGLAGPISGLVMGYGVTRGLSRSIYRLSVRVQDMAQHLDRGRRTDFQCRPPGTVGAGGPSHYKEVGTVNLVADGDLQNLDRQMEHIVRRVEESAGACSSSSAN